MRENKIGKGGYGSYAVMYLFYYISSALFSGLISVYLMDQGFRTTQVSLVVSASMVISMLTQPIIGNIYDRADKKRVSAVLFLTAGLFACVFPFVRNIIGIAVIYSIIAACFNGSNPVIEKMATTSKHKYGMIRIWGTFGYAFGSQLGGLLYQYVSPRSMYWFFGIGILVCMTGMLGTEDMKITGQEKTDSGKENGTEKTVHFGKTFAIYLIIVCLFTGATGVHSTYLPQILQSSGLAVGQTSTVIFLGTLMEFPVVMFAGNLINRLSNKMLLYILFGIIALQFSVLCLVPSLCVCIPVIILTKSVATMANIMINLKIVASIVAPANQITALSLVASVKSLAGIGFQLVYASVLEAGGRSWFYGTLLLVCGAAFLLIQIAGFENGRQETMF